MSVEPIEAAWGLMALAGLIGLLRLTWRAALTSRDLRESGQNGTLALLAGWRVWLFGLLALCCLLNVVLVVPLLFLPPRGVELVGWQQRAIAGVAAITGPLALFGVNLILLLIGVVSERNWRALRRQGRRRVEW